MKYNAEIERQKQTAVAMMVCVLKRLLNDTVHTINLYSYAMHSSI